MLWQERGVVNFVVELGSNDVGLVVYRREEGGRNKKYRANISKTTQDMTKSGARCVLTQYGVMLAKGEIVRESIPGVPCFRAEERRGKVASLIC